MDFELAYGALRLAGWPFVAHEKERCIVCVRGVWSSEALHNLVGERLDIRAACQYGLQCLGVEFTSEVDQTIGEACEHRVGVQSQLGGYVARIGIDTERHPDVEITWRRDYTV